MHFADKLDKNINFNPFPTFSSIPRLFGRPPWTRMTSRREDKAEEGVTEQVGAAGFLEWYAPAFLITGRVLCSMVPSNDRLWSVVSARQLMIVVCLHPQEATLGHLELNGARSPKRRKEVERKIHWQALNSEELIKLQSTVFIL